MAFEEDKIMYGMTDTQYNASTMEAASCRNVGRNGLHMPAMDAALDPLQLVFQSSPSYLR